MSARPYIAVVAAVFLVAGTWQVASWKYEAEKKDAIKAAHKKYEKDVKAANDKAADLERKLQETRAKAKTNYKEVIRYVESKPDDPVCFDDDALRLFNSDRH